MQPPAKKIYGRQIAVRQLAPSIITLIALGSGLTGIRFALLGNFEFAVLAITVSAVLDVLDGRVAIMFKAQSRFGAELDSLADLISFGVAPAFILYIWTLLPTTDHEGARGLGWMAALLFVLCGALRLARYNTLDDASSPEIKEPAPHKKKMFTGMPTPGAAGLALMPMIYSFTFETEIFRNHPKLIAVWLILLGLLMVSRLPTMALKGWRISAPFVLPLLIAVVTMFAGLFTEPFPTLTVIGTLYALLIPTFYLLQRRMQRKDNN